MKNKKPDNGFKLTGGTIVYIAQEGDANKTVTITWTAIRKFKVRKKKEFVEMKCPFNGKLTTTGMTNVADVAETNGMTNMLSVDTGPNCISTSGPDPDPGSTQGDFFVGATASGFVDKGDERTLTQVGTIKIMVPSDIVNGSRYQFNFPKSFDATLDIPVVPTLSGWAQIALALLVIVSGALLLGRWRPVGVGS